MESKLKNSRRVSMGRFVRCQKNNILFNIIFLYHQKGIEGWTQSSLNYSRVCDKKLMKEIIKKKDDIL